MTKPPPSPSPSAGHECHADHQEGHQSDHQDLTATTQTPNPYFGRPFNECRHAMLADESCPYPRIVTAEGLVLFVGNYGLLYGKNLIDEPPRQDQINELAELLEVVPQIKKPWLGCYQLKHDLRRSNLVGYVTNGVMISASYKAGLKMQPIYGSPNCKVNVSKKWHRDFLQMIDGPQKEYPKAGDYVLSVKNLKGMYPYFVHNGRKIYFDSIGLFTGQRYMGSKPDFRLVFKARKLLETLPRSEQANTPIAQVHRLVNARIAQATVGDTIAAALQLEIPLNIEARELKLGIDLA
jgi:hypothetical protein